jgi:hypothetical protein
VSNVFGAAATSTPTLHRSRRHCNHLGKAAMTSLYTPDTISLPNLAIEVTADIRRYSKFLHESFLPGRRVHPQKLLPCLRDKQQFRINTTVKSASVCQRCNGPVHWGCSTQLQTPLPSTLVKTGEAVRRSRNRVAGVQEPAFLRCTN